VLRDEQPAAHREAGQRDAQGKHAQSRFKAHALRGPLPSTATARPVNANASISRCPLCRLGLRWHISIDGFWHMGSSNHRVRFSLFGGRLRQ
jgi:hypothetical protein